MERNPPTPSTDVTLQRVGNEAILHDQRNGRAHVLNATAARVWNCAMAAPHSIRLLQRSPTPTRSRPMMCAPMSCIS